MCLEVLSLLGAQYRNEILASGRILDWTPKLVEGEGKDRDIRQPTIAKWLEGVALRDMQLHKRHAACVDARGDVYQWGDGFFGPVLEGGMKPIPTLKGMVCLFSRHDIYD